MTLLDLHEMGAKLQEGGSDATGQPDHKLLVKALLQAIHEIDVLNDRINRLEANTIVRPTIG